MAARPGATAGEPGMRAGEPGTTAGDLGAAAITPGRAAACQVLTASASPYAAVRAVAARPTGLAGSR
nr:hypothetical protein GCM10020093_012480 [Planobispora longispora]